MFSHGNTLPRCCTSFVNLGPALVVELVAVEPEPVAQPVAAPVVEGEPGLMHPRPRRLADDEQPRRRAPAHDRPRPERQMRSAQAAGADFGEEAIEFRFGTGVGGEHGGGAN